MPVGIELKIDYGPDYEAVRIRKGYSRLPDDSSERLCMEEQFLPSATLADITKWCVSDIKISLDFLLNLDLESMGSGPQLRA